MKKIKKMMGKIKERIFNSIPIGAAQGLECSRYNSEDIESDSQKTCEEQVCE